MDTLLPSITLVNIVLMLMLSLILDPLLSLRVIQITLFLDMDIQDVEEEDNGIHLSASPNVKVKILKVLFAIAVYVGCIGDPVISVRVLCLLHNNSIDCSW